LHALFEEPVTVKARVGRIDFLKHSVTLLPAEEAQHGNHDRAGQTANPSAPLDRAQR
jgi:hypothetical protein